MIMIQSDSASGEKVTTNCINLDDNDTIRLGYIVSKVLMENNEMTLPQCQGKK